MDDEIPPVVDIDAIERDLAAGARLPPDEVTLTQEVIDRFTHLLWQHALDRNQINALAAVVWLVERTVTPDTLSVRFTVEAFDSPYPITASIAANSCEVMAYPQDGDPDIPPRWYTACPEISSVRSK